MSLRRMVLRKVVCPLFLSTLPIPRPGEHISSALCWGRAWPRCGACWSGLGAPPAVATQTCGTGSWVPAGRGDGQGRGQRAACARASRIASAARVQKAGRSGAERGRARPHAAHLSLWSSFPGRECHASVPPPTGVRTPAPEASPAGRVLLSAPFLRLPASRCPVLARRALPSPQESPCAQPACGRAECCRPASCPRGAPRPPPLKSGRSL